MYILQARDGRGRWTMEISRHRTVDLAYKRFVQERDYQEQGEKNFVDGLRVLHVTSRKSVPVYTWLRDEADRV